MAIKLLTTQSEHTPAEGDLLGVAKLGANVTINENGDLEAEVDTSGLADVATSGSYNDLVDTPEIPTINSASIGAAVNGGAAADATPADTDIIPIVDVSATNVVKKFTIAAIKTWLNTLYLRLSGGTLTGALTASGHGTATTPEVVNVCYGTSTNPPAVETVPEGTIYVQHT